jgi:hypothetical protein
VKRYYVLDSDDLLEESACDPAHATAVVLASDVERLEEQLRQHAETCKESAFPLGMPK